MDTEQPIDTDITRFFSPATPVSLDINNAGYVQIVVTDQGRIAVRGSRLLVEWFMHTLAAEGWHVQFDALTWCG